MATEAPVDDYEGFDVTINTALVEALDALDVAFEQYEALEDLPHTRIEINGYGVDMLDDLAVALHRDYRTGLGYGFEQPELRAASELVQTAADALREYASGAGDSQTHLAELCRQLLAAPVTPATAQELVTIARSCTPSSMSTERAHVRCGAPARSGGGDAVAG